MYKKAWCTCNVVVLLIKPIVFLTFSLLSASLDLKVPIRLSEMHKGREFDTLNIPRMGNLTQLPSWKVGTGNEW